MFDLCILYGFYQSRNWRDLNKKELKALKDSDVNLIGFSPEVSKFLNEIKSKLIKEYEEHLQS